MPPFFKNMSLAVKLNILVLLVLALLLVSIDYLLIHNTQSLTEEIGGERVLEEVNIIRSRLAEIEKELAVDTDFVVTSVNFFQAVGRRDKADTGDIIATANQTLGLDDIAVVDGDGKRLVDTQIEADSSEEDALLLSALEGKKTTALLIENDSSGPQISIAAAAPVVSSSRNILGAIQMSRNVSELFLTDLTFGRKGIHLGLVYNGKVIERSLVDGVSLPINDPNMLGSGIMLDAASVQQAEAGEAVVSSNLVLGDGGVPHTVAYTPILADSGASPSPAVIVIVIELEEIFSFQNRTLSNTLLVFAALTVIALAVIYINIYRTMIRPLNQLKTIAHTMTSGKYDERAPVPTTDEVGQLAIAFNEMATAIQQREISLKAAREQAERADKVKSLFLASVSHELRTPLNAIINLTKFVSLGMYGAVNAEQDDILRKVEKSSKHLLNLINDVLDISKIESGSLELFVENGLVIDKIVSPAVETARTLVVEKPIDVTYEIEPDLPPITGDEQRLGQIVLNLLSNACKFTEKGEIAVKVWRKNAEIIISIRDTGPGIEAGSQELIFESFRQAKGGLRKGSGTGLGLPISRRLAEAHGGCVWVESTAGQGATFFVALPIETSLVPTV
ncbi:MAG: ATP-binding protein [Anaerolineae bacterium]